MYKLNSKSVVYLIEEHREEWDTNYNGAIPIHPHFTDQKTQKGLFSTASQAPIFCLKKWPPMKFHMQSTVLHCLPHSQDMTTSG